jgi:hypothetical protein
MAKIGSLEVDTLNIASAAISGSVRAEQPIGGAASFSVAVSNPSGLPIQVYFQTSATYVGGTTNHTGFADCTITRARDGAVLYIKGVGWSGATSSTQLMDGQILDVTATTSETYTMTMTKGTSGDPPAPSVTFGARWLVAYFVKK